MKRATTILAAAATLAAATYMIMAQQPREAGRKPEEPPARQGRPDRDDRQGGRVARQAPTKSGVVAEFHTNPDGDTAGLRLEDGTVVRFPPSAGEKVTSAVSLKDRVTIEGWTHPGESEIHAATIKHDRSGKLVVVDRPPPEISQSGRRDGPDAREDDADDRKPAREPEEGDRGPRTKPKQKPKPKGQEPSESPATETANTRPAQPAPTGKQPAPRPRAEPGPTPGFVRIPAGQFEMGDHHGFVDPKHGGDETPIHTVRLDSFCIGIHDVTTKEYVAFLNSALGQKLIEVRDGGVYLVGERDLLAETRGLSPHSRLGWERGAFTVLDQKEQHPIVCIRWPGAAAYCNWLSAQQRLPQCYDTSTWGCDFNKSGYRLPTEAEWEYAARGGQTEPYWNFPWANEADSARANWPESRNPYRTGPLPWTTPVGFFNGQLQRKADFDWPGTQETFQTADGANGFGLYDMAGNVWQFINDWYDRDYYAYSPAENPPGPERGSPMPDGKPYPGMRGGNWYNGEHGHSRVSNRNPSYFRGPQDPDHPYYHLSFRVVLPIDAESRPVIKRAGFVLRSPAVAEGGMLPQEFTGDGDSATPPIEWSGAPAGTRSFAVIMHHIAPDQTKWYWVLYNIPADVTRLPKNVQGIGTLGNNSVNDEVAYAPPRSKGPGAKKYTLTVYALSAAPKVSAPAKEVSRDVLLAAMKDSILATAELNVIYSRGEQTAESEPRPRPDQDGPLNRASRWDLSPTPQAPQRKPDDERKPRRPEEPPEPSGDAGTSRQPVPGGQTVGLVKNDPQACPGYTLFAPKHHTMIYLMDNAGRAVHRWDSQYEPGQSVYLLQNGHLLHCCFTKNKGFTSGGEGGRLEEFDWEGNLVWEFEYSTDHYLSHHDVKPLPNGNVLVLAVEKKSYEECLAAGFDPRMLRDRQLFPEFFIEVQPTRPKGGKIVWEWHVWDHLIQDNDRSQANYGDVKSHPELVDVNCNRRGAPAFWNHGNSIAYNAELDQVMLSARGCNEIWIVDHGTTTKEAASHTGGKRGKGGDLLYRWGNPAAYRRGTSDDRQLFQQHDAQWIPEGYPGAGHIMIFNNGLDRGYSTIEEIVPPMDDRGNYVLSPKGVFGPDKAVWRYQAENPEDFYSSEISGAHRLPNGNTLICAGVKGTFFEVTPAGKTVWQYVNPVVHNGILAQGELPGKDHRGHSWNAVFKIHRYEPNYSGLADKDLKPIGPIEQPAAECGKTGFHDQAAEGRPAGKEARGKPGRPDDERREGGERPKPPRPKR